MELQELIDRAKSESLSEAEQAELATKIQEEIASLKQNDPEKYVALLAGLNDVLAELAEAGKEG